MKEYTVLGNLALVLFMPLIVWILKRESKAAISFSLARPSLFPTCLPHLPTSPVTLPDVVDCPSSLKGWSLSSQQLRRKKIKRKKGLPFYSFITFPHFLPEILLYAHVAQVIIIIKMEKWLVRGVISMLSVNLVSYLTNGPWLEHINVSRRKLIFFTKIKHTIMK